MKVPVVAVFDEEAAMVSDPVLLDEHSRMVLLGDRVLAWPER